MPAAKRTVARRPVPSPTPTRKSRPQSAGFVPTVRLDPSQVVDQRAMGDTRKNKPKPGTRRRAM